MPNPAPPRSVLLQLDGVVHTGDLAVQSFARHVASAVPADRGRAVLAGMRGFLEGKPELLAAGTQLAGADLLDAEDGDRAVELLAAAAGLGAREVAAARRASRMDLAASAWIVEPADGVTRMLDLLDRRASVAVLTLPDDPAAGAVLAACGLTDRVELLALPTPAAVGRLLEGNDGEPRRVMAIGTRWSGDLEVAAAAGCLTVLVDRFGRGRGAPTWRTAGCAGLVDIVRSWIQAH